MPEKSLFMREESFRQAIRLRLLALVLALALTWYVLNPVLPGASERVKRDKELPDEKCREAKSRVGGSYGLELTQSRAMKSATKPFSSGVEDDTADLEWPEVIEVC